MIIEDSNLKKIKSWDQYKKFTDTLNNKDKGNLFERLTQLFLKTDLLYRSIYKNVWLLNEVPSKIKKHLNLPALDEGIDLIAETYSGEFHSVQSKYKNNNSRLNYKELSTFNSLSFTVCKNISAALVVTTGSSPKKEKLMPKVTYCDFSKLSYLDKENWLSIRNSISGKIQKPKIKKPFDYQKDIVEKLESHFKNEERGKFFVPCGTGKTLIAFWAVQKLMPKKIIVAVPSIQLVGQFMREWAEEFLANGIKPDWLIVCSDEKTGKFDYQDKDAFISSVYDLGVKATTDKDEIITALKRKSKIQIVITTYQSGKVIAQASKKSKTTFDFGVFDEAHKTVGKESKLYSHLIFEKNINIKKRMFMTATAKIWGGPKDAEVISMDDNSKHYGKTVADMTFKDAIEIKNSPICDYEIITLNILKKEIEELWESNSFLSSKKMDEVEARHLAATIMLKKLYKEHGVKLSISFHNSRSGAKRFREIVDNLKSSWGILGFESHYIDGEMDSYKKNIILNNFANSENSLITNARCLTEGVNIKAVDCVMFVDQKQSIIDIVQAAGRALRKNPKFNKRKGMTIEKGLIAIPVIIPDGNDLETVENKEFLAVRRVISNLTRQDNRIAEELKYISEGKTPSTKIINIHSSAKLTQEIDIKNFEKSIRNVVWKRVAKINWLHYVEAKKMVNEEGLKSETQFRKWSASGKRPHNFPSSPDVVYKGKGWTSWGDFLESGYMGYKERKGILSTYEEAKKIAYEEGITTSAEYLEWSKSGKRPPNMPGNPNKTYKGKGWTNWKDFLPPRSSRFIEYEEAKKVIQKEGIKSSREFNEWSASGKRPHNFPSSPEVVYKGKGWINWGHFVGSGRISNVEKQSYYLKYEEAKKIVRRKKINSAKDYRNLFTNKKPKKLPSQPSKFYKGKGWTSWEDFLGTKIEFIKYDQAKKIAIEAGIKTIKEYKEWSKSGKRPPNMPANPQKIYKGKGWTSWGNFLENGFFRVSKPLPYEEAKKLVRKKGIKTSNEYENWIQDKRPSNMPSNPHNTYKGKGWTSWGNFLGTNNLGSKAKQKSFALYEEAKKVIQKEGIKSFREFNDWSKSGKRPPNIPSRPNNTYKGKGWTNWKDFLGPMSSRYFEYEEAKKIVSEEGIKYQNKYIEWLKSDKSPIKMPLKPERVYKGKGWTNWKDFLAPRPSRFIEYEELKKIVNEANIKTAREYREWSKSGKRPPKIPANPHNVYKGKGWTSWEDFLGTKIEFIKYDQAKKIAIEASIKTKKEYREWSKSGKRPPNMPGNPNDYYKGKGWTSWAKFLGTNNSRRKAKQKSFASYEEAKKIVNEASIKTSKEYREWSKSGKRPLNIPSRPSDYYKGKGWTNWKDFLRKN